ncbi:MAG: nuclear transport factor 2 family protein [Acidobacteria bacterium]|nr:nuclear transport factor 2 family protein [Acidobacteriota bacterium]
MNPRIRLAALLSALALGGIVAYQYLFDPAAAVKRAVQAAAGAFENRNLDGFMAAVSRNYADDQSMTYDGVREAASEAFQAFEAFNVTLEKVEITVDGSTARFTALATVVATTRDREKYMAIGTPESGQRLELELHKEDGTWRVTSAHGYAR